MLSLDRVTSEDLVRYELFKINRRLWTEKLSERQYKRLIVRKQNLLRILRGC